MISDEWIELGYTSSEPIEVSDIVFYRVWTDQAGAEIGVSVDFEIENDFHYTMPISDWQTFTKNVLRVNDPNGVTQAFQEYFIKNPKLFDFERDLKISGIWYQKFFF